MSVFPVNRVVDPENNNRKKWRTEEEERHKGSQTLTNVIYNPFLIEIKNKTSNNDASGGTKTNEKNTSATH
jgi:hypothetical protein